MSLQEKIIKHQEQNTPRFDHLAHFYWGDRHWATLGSIVAILIIFVFKVWFSISLWLLPVCVFPYLVARYAGKSKEKRDATGLGNVDKEDITFTIIPSYKHCIFLFLIVVLAS